MTPPRSLRSVLSAAIAVSAIGVFFAIPALAQVKDKDYYAASYDEEIIVIAPGVDRTYEGRTYSGARIETLTTQRVVTTADLDLRYDSDVRELRRRIHATAVDACRDIETSTANSMLDSRAECVRGAERSASAQADALIYAAG